MNWNTEPRGREIEKDVRPTARTKSILVIAPEASMSETIGDSLASDPNVRVDTQSSTLSEMNGRAIKAMADYDAILFQTSPDDEADLKAIRELVAQRKSGTALVALADGNITLKQAPRAVRCRYRRGFCRFRPAAATSTARSRGSAGSILRRVPEPAGSSRWRRPAAGSDRRPSP